MAKSDQRAPEQRITEIQAKRLQWRSKRVKVPTILQMEALECGAASLAMVLAYYGRFVPLEQLRIECGVNRDGSKASNMLRAARNYGFEAKGYKREPEGLREFPLPMIVFWNFNHFVVLTGMKKNQVFLNDPASGPKVVSKEEFDQAFTGVVLVFEPGPAFEKGGEKPNILHALNKRLQGAKIALAYAVLAGLFLVVPGLAVPTFLKVFVDNILVRQMYGWLRPLLFAMGLTAVLRGALTWVQQRYLLRLETKQALTWSAKFFQHLFRLPVQFFFQRQAGDLGNRVQLNDQVAQLLSGQLATTMLNMLLIVFYGIIMVQYDLFLTGLSISIAALNVIMLQYVARKRLLLGQKVQMEGGKLIGTAMSGLQMIETLKATGAENDFFALWSGYQATAFNVQQELSRTTQLLTAIPPFLTSLNTVGIIVFGGWRVIDGQLSMGMLVAFQSLTSSFISPVNQLVNLGATIQETTASINRLDDVYKHQADVRFSRTDEIDEGAGNAETPVKRASRIEIVEREVQKQQNIDKLDGYVELRNVTFGYSLLEAPLIEDFNLSLQPGERVALVGRSGSGKSTIAKLITGLYRPWSGELLFDRFPREHYSRGVLKNSISAVDQEIFLFSGTVRDNLSMWDSTVPEINIVRAARDACIHYDIGARPGAYQSEVGEGGRNFSGGQRQRLEIARALVNNPRVLILDEATSALDTKTEKFIDDNIRRRGCTTIIVAHRLSTIRDADEIIILENGKVVQRGTHDEMIRTEGAYKKLIESH